MNIRMQTLAFLTLSRYFMLKKQFESKAYDLALEEIRDKYEKGYNPDEFKGDITITKNNMRKSGVMKKLMSMVYSPSNKKDLSYEKIFHFLEEIQKPKVLASDHNLRNLDIKKPKNNDFEIADYHFQSSGGVPDCIHDVLSEYEAHFLHLEEFAQKAEHYIAPKATNQIPEITKISKRKRIKRLIESMQTHLPFYYTETKLSF